MKGTACSTEIDGGYHSPAPRWLRVWAEQHRPSDAGATHRWLPEPGDHPAPLYFA